MRGRCKLDDTIQGIYSKGLCATCIIGTTNDFILEVPVRV